MFVGIQALADFQQETRVKIYQEMGSMSGECFTLGWLHWLLLSVSWSFCRDSSAVCKVPGFWCYSLADWGKPGWIWALNSFKLYTEKVWLLLCRQKSCPCHKYGNYWEGELTLSWLQRSQEVSSCSTLLSATQPHPETQKGCKCIQIP